MKHNTKNLRRYKKLCKEIWDEREHVCADCGKYLSEPKYQFFHHEKGRIKDTLNKNTITLLCSKHHALRYGQTIHNSEWLDF